MVTCKKTLNCTELKGIVSQCTNIEPKVKFLRYRLTLKQFKKLELEYKQTGTIEMYYNLDKELFNKDGEKIGVIEM